MYELAPEAFEHHVADTYAALGYVVNLTRRIGDQGIDVLAVRGLERIGIQCKRTTEPTSNSAVQEAHAGKSFYHCTSTMVIALGGFTTAAKALAISTGVALLDGPAYASVFHAATGSTPQRSIWNVLPTRRTLASSSALLAGALCALLIGIAGSNAARQQPVAQAVPIFAQASSPANTVQDFYNDIDQRKYEAAYALLSPSFRSGMTLSQFRAGYATTARVAAITSAAVGDRQVLVRLTAVDHNRDGSLREAAYDGYWRVIPDGNGGWLLAQGHFRKI